MNLTASNLLTCTVLNPLLIMDSPSARTTLTSTSSSSSSASSSSSDTFGTMSMSSTSTSMGNICMISEGATALITTSSVLSVLLIAIDQYFAVVDPLRYRSRIDKLKSGVLIVSIWFISAVFGLVASLNPSPRSLWLSCTVLDNSTIRDTVINASTETTINPTFTFLSNETAEDFENGASSATIESIKINRSIGLLENSIENFRILSNDTVTYGLIYVVMHSVLAYLLPFAGVCWIYISIYSAAHRNSERTRRTGSRPILESASFCEDQYSYVKPQQPIDAFVEEDTQHCRRIPKISSLSSIDETSETTHSPNQATRRRSFSVSSEAAQSMHSVENTSGVVFTMGLQPLEVSPLREQDCENRTERRNSIVNLKTKFHATDCDDLSYKDLISSIRSTCRDTEADSRQKSSHDLTYETCELSSNWIPNNSNSYESDDEPHYGYFDSFEIFPTKDRRYSDYLVSLTRCETMEGLCDTENSQGDYSEKITCRNIEEGEDSIMMKTCGYSAIEQMQDEIPVSDDSSYRKPKRSGRRSSKSGILNVESQVSHQNTENAGNNVNNNAESSTGLLTPIVTITPAPSKNGTLNRVSSVRSTSSYINSLKHRISNGSLFKYREETRAARVSALVIVMGLICWSPYVLLSVIKNLPQYSDYEFPHEYDVLALSFLILAAYISPLLFGYRSRRVKRELRKFFCFHRELSYKNNRSLMAKKVLKRRHSSTLSHLEPDNKYNIFNCVYGKNRSPKEKVQFVQVPETALAVETCRSSFSSGASTQISSTSTEDC